ncbi:hypothetical protein PMAC_001511 [Pneumocystis sp. 'macacae']|nr:hypothetical protein PMAC_001511 [Pneumocystis sp. 'macacae']
MLAFYSEMKDFCGNEEYEKTCNNFKKNIEPYCEKLEKILENFTTGSLEFYKQCLMQTECILLQQACPQKLKEKCNNLRSLCQQEKRNNLMTVFLLRAFSGNLKKTEDCEKVIDEKCLMFMGESDELMKFCLTALNRCENLIKLAKTKCEEIEVATQNLRSFIDTCTNIETLKKMCILSLKGCYFHKSNCNASFQNICKGLEEKCGEEKKYIPSYLTLDPLEKEITLIDKIEYKELFEDEIGKPGTKDTIDLLALISNNDMSACESNIERCYKFCSSLPQLKDLYDNTEKKMKQSKKEICTNIKDKLKSKCETLKSRLYSLSMSSAENDDDSIVLGWFEQSGDLDERLCINLESECFYLQKHCTNINIKMDNACTNLKSTCLKTRLFRKSYQLFQDLLRGKMHILAEDDFFEICANELLELCKTKIGVQNPILIDFCLRPWDTCYVLGSDIERQSRKLRISLGWNRDFPNEENCKELQEKCETLGKDSRMNNLPCLTLKERCDHLRNAKELEEILLKKIKKLNNLDICIREVAKVCNSMSRTKRTGFSLSCIRLNITCQMIARDIKFKCNTLGKNMDFMKVLEKTKDENTAKGPECDLWEPYCDKYMLNCEKLVEDSGKDGKCKELKKNCGSYRNLQNRENEVMYMLQGSLKKDKCKSVLDEHCLNWTKTNNNTFKNFCNDNTGVKNDAARIELCQKLEKRMKERCTKLFTKLNTMATEIEENVGVLEELNKVAEKALKNVKLTLDKQKTDINHAALILLYNANANIKRDLRADALQKDYPKYLQQKDANVNITDGEAMAFDATTEALKVYVEVKAECKNLLLECGFKDDCSEYKGACEKIKEACNKLEPLKLKSSEKEATNQTIIEATITETIIIETKSDGTQKTVTAEGQCLLVRTMDRWVTSTSIYTRTSTQTSIVTSTVTLTSQRQCKPTKCTTKGEEDAGDIKPSEGIRMSGWSLMKEIILVMVISAVV